MGLISFKLTQDATESLKPNLYLFNQKSLFSSVYPTYHNEVTGCILVSLKHEVSKQSFVVNPVRVKYVPRKRHVGYGEC